MDEYTVLWTDTARGDLEAIEKSFPWDFSPREVELRIRLLLLFEGYPIRQAGHPCLTGYLTSLKDAANQPWMSGWHVRPQFAHTYITKRA